MCWRREHGVPWKTIYDSLGFHWGPVGGNSTCLPNISKDTLTRAVKVRQCVCKIQMTSHLGRGYFYLILCATVNEEVSV